MTDYQLPPTADGSLVRPAELRAEMGWQPGDGLTVECDGDSLLIRRREEATDAVLAESRHRREQLRADFGTGPDSAIGIRAERDEC